MRHVAVLIDGGYLLKRLPAISGKSYSELTAGFVIEQIKLLVYTHLKTNSLVLDDDKAIWSNLYRSFYYDANPYSNRGHRFVSKSAVDYGKTPEAIFRLALFDGLRKLPSMALRLGEIQKGEWQIKPSQLIELQNGTKQFHDLIDDDFTQGFRQKGVDMRLGMDMTALALKKQADTIVLVTGDTDFVPVAKLVRREGVKLILDPLWRSVPSQLHEHIDDLHNGLPRFEK